jgi:hypothetical protein
MIATASSGHLCSRKQERFSTPDWRLEMRALPLRDQGK